MEPIPQERQPGGRQSARPVEGFSPQLRRRLFIDRLARRFVTLGGVTIITSILAILIVITAEVYPLFRKPKVEHVRSFSSLPAPVLHVGMDEYRSIAYLVTSSGVHFVSIEDGTPVPAPELDLGTAHVTTVAVGEHDTFAIGLSDGRILPVTIRFDLSYVENRRVLTPALNAGTPVLMSASAAPLRVASFATTADGSRLAAATEAREITIVSLKQRKSLVGAGRVDESRHVLFLATRGVVTALLIDHRGEDLFAGTDAGELVRVDLRSADGPRIAETETVDAGIRALRFLLGDRTLLVGDANGLVTSWQLLRAENASWRLRRMHTFGGLSAAVTAISPSRRDKGFVAADATGRITLNYGTTGRTLAAIDAANGAATALVFGPKGDSMIAVDHAGTIHDWTIRNPHPEITWRSLFGKIWYEGYDAPAFVWQSTGGTDDFEAKLSLTPLIYGTLKGTFYALLFAIPVALLSALYASQFMHPSLKGVIKPTVEIMAALPSVVLGFIAGLWLAPMMERIVPGIMLMPIVLAVVIVLALAIWRRIAGVFHLRMRAGMEIFLLLPVVLCGVWLAIQLGGLAEHHLMASDYRSWMLRALGWSYDQRNSMVVGFAMGFAVVPIIFTIAEDSLSSVPNHLKAASLALGATPWQTAIRVVLPTASPGIFSAIMIGFGRAVGETMIVLMATGNTPVMNWSVFSGFRALSANIAVELPEAPEGGTLFRVLFMAALLLFIVTFVLNTLAEIVRLRLRKRYRYL